MLLTCHYLVICCDSGLRDRLGDLLTCSVFRSHTRLLLNRCELLGEGWIRDQGALALTLQHALCIVKRLADSNGLLVDDQIVAVVQLAELLKFGLIQFSL